jgi:Mor family transcriptional regulator
LRKRRDCTVTYDFSNLKLHEQQEIIDPILQSPSRKSQSRYFVPLTQIPEEQWEDIARRNVAGESLRLLAKDYGVSHEAIRQVIRKVRERIQVGDKSITELSLLTS